MKISLFAKVVLVFLLASCLDSTLQASVKCSATLIDGFDGSETKIELTLFSGDELMAMGYEKSKITGSRVRSSEVYAVISAGQFGALILEIPNIRADRGAGGYIADANTFQQIVTRGRIHTKSFNTENTFSLDSLAIIP
jgi:hypothetical protein